MHFELISSKLGKVAQEKTDALILFITPDASSQAYLPPALKDTLAFALKNGDLEAQKAPLISLYRPSDCKARHVRIVYIDTAPTASMTKLIATVRKHLYTAVQSLPKDNIQSLIVGFEPLRTAMAQHTDDEQAVFSLALALIEGAQQALYTYAHTKPSAKLTTINKVRFACDAAKTFQKVFDQAVGLGQGIACAREWGNRPANHATPSDLAQAAQALAKATPRLSCTVLDRAAIAKLKMNAFLAVAQGSKQAPKFIILEYKGGAKSQAPIVLVGKGITFDTGGISLKPAAQMDEMKFDMCGAASVLGTFEALARIGPKVNVVGLIPTCENMPSGQAIKPGDVITSMSGQTIEILNTDAEGRLILCDALTYASRYKPTAIIDIATLTGACVIALGGVRAGLFSNNDALADDLSLAGEKSSDPCWRMPLDSDYAEGLQSNFADIANVAGREAGSVTAAKFLEKFIEDETPWAHLDIAGVAWKVGKNKGATGRPVALLMHYLLSKAS